MYRRYNDFVAFKRQLELRYNEQREKMAKFGQIPPLPGDTFFSLIGKGRFDPEFVNNRMKKLDDWLKGVARHNLLRFEPIFQKFVSDEHWSGY